MGLKRVERIIKVICDECLGLGEIATGKGRIKCDECGGSGEKDKVVTELVEEG